MWSHFQIKSKYHNQIIGFPIIMYVIYQVIQICKEHLESVLITRTSKEKYPGECECLIVRWRDEKLQIIPLNLTIFFYFESSYLFPFLFDVLESGLLLFVAKEVQNYLSGT